MRVVLDASVAVAAVRPNEPDHIAARARVDRIVTGRDELVVPALFPIEVSAALARRAAWSNAQTGSYLTPLLGPPARVVSIGARRSQAIAQLAVATKLRAADAVYVWVAAREGVPLVTSDDEVIRRAASVCSVERP